MSEDPAATRPGVEPSVRTADWTRKLPLVSLPEPVERWEQSGGMWRVASVEPDRATVELLRCDGGEVAETLQLRDPRDVRWAVLQSTPEECLEARICGRHLYTVD